MNGKSKKVLIVEDDHVSREILETMLERWGYVVVTAVDGREAWSKFQADDDIQLVISDWMMPHIDGIDFCRMVRGLDSRHYTYFIFLTAKTQIDDIVAGMEAGADDFVTKPFNQTELLVRIRAGERVVELENRLANNVSELSKAYDQMRLDLEAAALVQRSMLPPEQGRYEGLRYAWSYIPSDKIGGDLFNVVKLDKSRVGIFIFDVSGHGVPAALQSVALGRMLSPYESHSSLLLKPAQENGHSVVSPREVTTALNLRFQFATYRGDFITFLYGVMDSETMTFTYTRAGHPCPLHISDGRAVDVCDDGGIPLGIIPDYEYVEHAVHLKKGDRLYFYTDGIIESVNSDGKMFNEKRLSEHLRDSSRVSLEDSISGLMEQVMSWQARSVGIDDMTILGIEIDDE